MPGKSERTKVEVKESSTLDLRCFSITLTAPVNDFLLTDLLRQRGVIAGLESELKQSVRQATEDYLKSAEVLISGLASNASSTKKSHKNLGADREQSVTSKDT